MARSPTPQRPRQEPLYDIHPRTGASIEVFYADRTHGDVRQVRRRLVLVLSPTGLSAERAGDWSIFVRATQLIGMRSKRYG